MNGPSTYRVLPARDGWWALTATRAAHLPPEAARAGHLSDEAQRLLDGSAMGVEAVSKDRYALTVLTSTACNLGCQYCSQNTSTSADNAPPRIPRRSLDNTTIRDITAFVERQQRHTNRPQLSLLLFGGEPLLNAKACFELLRTLKPRNLVSASMVSNCVLLTPPLAAALSDAGLRSIQVTYDGDEAHHDRARVTRDGHPTFRTIISNVGRALEASALAFHVRVNVTRDNLHSLDALVAELAQLPERERLSLDLVLVEDVGIGFATPLSYEESMPPVRRAYQAAVPAGLRATPTSPTALCPFCSEPGGTVGAVVNADGTLYSCWETAGRTDMLVGTVQDGYLDDDVVLSDRWVACDHQARPKTGTIGRAAFNDEIDAFILDEQRACQRLTAASPG